VYSVRPRGLPAGAPSDARAAPPEAGPFLVFNQQFVTLVKAGLPILTALS
jgi:hypothetical protein